MTVIGYIALLFTTASHRRTPWGCMESFQVLVSRIRSEQRLYESGHEILFVGQIVINIAMLWVTQIKARHVSLAGKT